ncbi:hypothetical protein GCM10011351_15030 [Paraliobacillus quinghaiensis]|uniref:Uncharacterized protein n=1 Tax=Paraliobacillus quinghaiensis TaxID=470815 RepID=A0A917TQA5_9BACI|nr:hypothetical protein GCM10011351_15030 [Paraliobacillus quinghaiensis]
MDLRLLNYDRLVAKRIGYKKKVWEYVYRLFTYEVHHLIWRAFFIIEKLIVNSRYTNIKYRFKYILYFSIYLIDLNSHMYLITKKYQ